MHFPGLHLPCVSCKCRETRRPALPQPRAMTWDGVGAETGECAGEDRALFPIRDPSNSPVVDGGRVSVARPGIWPAPAGFNL